MFSRRTPSQAERERFGKIIRDARKRQDLTQEKLAELMNCSLRWINRVERGESSLNWKDTVKLLVVLELLPERVLEEMETDASLSAH